MQTVIGSSVTFFLPKCVCIKNVDMTFIWLNCCFSPRARSMDLPMWSSTLSEEEKESQRIFIGFHLLVSLVCGSSASVGISLDQKSLEESLHRFSF